MSFRLDTAADRLEMQVHGVGVGERQHECRSGVALRAHGAEQIGRLVALICRQARSCALPGPNAGAAILLANSGFILKPQFDRRVGRSAAQVGSEGLGEVFLNASMIWAS